MKQFLLLTITCALFATATRAQIQSITVNNYTNCDVFYAIRGDVGGSGCAGAYTSNVFSACPGCQITYPDAGPGGVPGGMNCGTCAPPVLAAGDDFVFIDLYDADPAACLGTIVGQVGDACSTFPVSFTYSVSNLACAACATVTATWDSATLTLDFN